MNNKPNKQSFINESVECNNKANKALEEIDIDLTLEEVEKESDKLKKHIDSLFEPINKAIIELGKENDREAHTKIAVDGNGIFKGILKENYNYNINKNNYTVQLKDRKNLGKLIENLKNLGITEKRITRSKDENYRYDISFKYLKEEDEHTEEKVEIEQQAKEQNNLGVKAFVDDIKTQFNGISNTLQTYIVGMDGYEVDNKECIKKTLTNLVDITGLEIALLDKLLSVLNPRQEEIKDLVDTVVKTEVEDEIKETPADDVEVKEIKPESVEIEKNEDLDKNDYYKNLLSQYKPSSNASKMFESIVKQNKLNDFQYLLEELYPNYDLTSDKLDDILWLEDDWLIKILNLIKDCDCLDDKEEQETADVEKEIDIKDDEVSFENKEDTTELEDEKDYDEIEDDVSWFKDGDKEEVKTEVEDEVEEDDIEDDTSWFKD